MLGHISFEERNNLIKILETKRLSPEISLIMAIFRDIYIFREMAQATILSYRNELERLKRELDSLKENEQ